MKKSALVFGLVLVGLTAISGVALAADVTHQGFRRGMGHLMNRGKAPGVFGTVTAINGTTLIVQSKNFGSNETTTTYTVDASKAVVTKSGSSSSVSSIAVGDNIMIVGTVSGTNVTATSIRDGLMRGKNGNNSQTPPFSIQGNGLPVVSGTVTAINGNTVTVTNKSNVTYTIDVTNATILKDRATSTLSYVATGDNIIAQGNVNGTSVTASSLIDNGAANGNSQPASRPGLFGGIFGFFQRLFGFF